jgi:hypothetical protein
MVCLCLAVSEEKVPAFQMLKFEDVVKIGNILVNNTVYCHFTIFFGSCTGENPANDPKLHNSI